MRQAMTRAGWQVGRDQTARLMRAAGLQGVRRGRKPITTRSASVPDARPDLVERRFTAERPHQLWVADITYVRILTGFCYVAFITDVCSRKIVGWAVSASLHTAGLPLLALEHALLSTGASRGREGLIHHWDRGAQGGFNRSSQHPRNHWRYWRWLARTGRGRSVTCPRAHAGSGERIGRCGPRCALRAGRSPHGMSNASSGV
ncbi:DDE-type integrase/transposase/recombinase [Micrococcus sp. FDAARGOS_333]|uniref:DDE-type integrase/transposase/recombinase n=1 Tax=Micrococcus sp. FDAARGOS_333 TaxID=1930558 RepID=UPI000B4E5C1D|nr:hypothetical protein CEQ11_005490 [Micrococcus sp. FDAARGOS_333]